MGVIDDNRLKRDVEQKNPTNPDGVSRKDQNKFDIDKKTIKGQQNKK